MGPSSVTVFYVVPQLHVYPEIQDISIVIFLKMYPKIQDISIFVRVYHKIQDKSMGIHV